MGDQMRRAWEDLLVAECAAHPLVLVLEDLHWGDLPSVKLIDAALRALEGRPLLVLAFARPEVHDLFPRMWAERGAQEIHLRELNKRASERLVRDVLGARVSDDSVARIVERAAGNAFYLEELIRAAEGGESENLPRRCWPWCRPASRRSTPIIAARSAPPASSARSSGATRSCPSSATRRRAASPIGCATSSIASS